MHLFRKVLIQLIQVIQFLVAQGTYFENLILDNQITLASHALLENLGANWLDNEHINNTVISGAQTPANSSQGSCLIIRMAIFLQP